MKKDFVQIVLISVCVAGIFSGVYAAYSKYQSADRKQLIAMQPELAVQRAQLIQLTSSLEHWKVLDLDPDAQQREKDLNLELLQKTTQDYATASALSQLDKTRYKNDQWVMIEKKNGFLGDLKAWFQMTQTEKKQHINSLLDQSKELLKIYAHLLKEIEQV